MQISPALPRPADAPKKWTILQYSACDNDLYNWMIQDIDEAEVVGSTDTMNLVAQVDHGSHGSCQRMQLLKDAARGIHSPVVEDLGSVNMSDPHTLADFIKWGVKNYPAENYMVIISDHGDGWKGACQDWSHDGWMSLPEIRQGLEEARQETGKKIDVLGFDACLMASSEVGYELRNEANYLVASEETEGASGWPYTRLLNGNMLATFTDTLSTRMNLDPKELAKLVVATAEKDQDNLPTMSAIDLSKMDNLAAAVSNLGDKLGTTWTSKSTLKGMADETQEFTGYKDLTDFAEKVGSNWRIWDFGLWSAARNVVSAAKDAVIAEQHDGNSYPNAKGITIELSNVGGEYQNTQFAKDTKWDEGVARLSE